MTDTVDLKKLHTTLQNITSNLRKQINVGELDNAALEDLKQAIRFVRNCCSKGTKVQDFITQQSEMIELMQLMGSNDLKHKDTIELLWQFIANLTVQNVNSQKFVWKELSATLLNGIRTQLIDNNTDKKLMIIYNICQSDSHDCSEKLALALLADLWHRIVQEKNNSELVFVDLFFEFFLVTNQWTVKLYATVSAQNRIDILSYVHSYIRNDSPNGSIRPVFMEYLSKEFKKKSDCILRSSGDMENSLHPQEVYSLLKVISCATGSEMYNNVYSRDDSLFLCMGALLQSIVALGKKAKNKFTPLTKLEEVAPGSKSDKSFESEISFELKTLLVRTIANLLHVNNANQRHCIDTELLPDLLECTVMDARNPLIKEWSILAIRNACFNCQEIQQLISQLTQTGVAPNELLADLNIEMGTLRIQPNE